MQTRSHWKSKRWRSVAQCFIGSIALALVTLVCFRLEVDLPTTAFAYLIVIVLLSLMGSFFVSAVLSIIAVGVLNYFFASPIFSFQVEEPQDAVLVIAFLLTSLIVTALVGKARSQREAALHAEAVLREQASLLNLTHDSIFVRDMHNIITYWNRGAEKLYGWTAKEVVGRFTTHELLQTVFPAPVEEIEADLLRAGHWEGELVHIKANKTKVVVASRWSLLRDEQQHPLRVLEINGDITSRKQAEEALKQAEAELVHVTRVTTLGELTASIAHEVKQPLAAVVVNADSCLNWLNHKIPQLGEARGAVERIIKDAHRATEVINRIRTLTTHAEPERTTLDINETIRETLLMLQRELLQQAVSLRLELAPTPTKVIGDRVQLQQVILNLLINGAEAMGKVSDRSHELLISSHQLDTDQVLVAIQDSGSGIDPENIDRLFTAFFTTKPRGMGMGLSICRSIIDAHGGRLWASNNDGPGATFQFTLPSDGREPPAPNQVTFSS